MSGILHDRELDVTKLDVTAYLPHRYPFLLIDRVLEIGEGRVRGLKNITNSDPVFLGHFPGYAIMPGVLLLEAMAQIGRFLIPLERKVEHPRLARITDVHFLREVVPGDQVILEAVLEGEFGSLIKYRTEAAVQGQAVARAEFIVNNDS
ncbi:3-hydroxyacyl-ACP dehydratase FabZ [Cohnella lubricantis]|uniref:3-hydroxyacyl-[acyl-carrier-protein] dehydratase n=1 Tax=Cohnella lubricantis TaxID=2163172 RepID=A0A841TBR1_9BACL|nr:3-hydroxyacyl-ACP dehydratase FabZ [Cohnella lubricantis]MBB6677465.1 3-hydroxyacyl-ACP dehydratase FabZ [Cohnella lubricantis]MBP2116649.1 3-hydroxyacyl-[acyl-carrier-protein] dehydratase [Cohnella lubricantis]